MPTQYQEDLAKELLEEVHKHKDELKKLDPEELKAELQKTKEALEKKLAEKKDAPTPHPATTYQTAKAFAKAKAKAKTTQTVAKPYKTAGQVGGSQGPQGTQGVYGFEQASEWADMPAEEGRRNMRNAALEREMEKILDTAEPMMEISAKIMEIKGNDEIGEKLGRATARYCDRMMEYLQDEGFSREESMKLLCSMVRNNSAITGG